MQVRFLTSPKILTDYTTGACRSLALSLSSMLPGSTVIGIGSDKMEGYTTLEFSEEGAYFTTNHNPLHYLVKYRQKYIDVYGVYGNRKAVIDHYNDFYRNYLADAEDRIDIRFWEGQNDDHNCKEEIPIELLEFIVKNVNHKGFKVYKNITPDEFARALEIVFDAKTYANGVSQIGKYYITMNGFATKPRELIPRKLDVEISDLAMQTVYCLPMNLFVQDEVFQPWFHQPWDAPDNILSRLSGNNKQYPSLLTNEELTTINESLVAYLSVEDHLCYDNYYYLLKNPTYRDLLKVTEFNDPERQYIQFLILNSKVKLSYYDRVLKGNIMARLNYPWLETDFDKVESMDRLGHHIKWALERGQTKTEAVEEYVHNFRLTLEYINRDYSFLLGVTNLYMLSYERDKIEFRDYTRSIMYCDDFYVNDQHRENDIYKWVRDNLEQEYVDKLDRREYVDVDLAIFWHLVDKFE